MSSPLVLVTGGSGFVGSHIISALRKDWPECNITNLDRAKGPSTLDLDLVEADITVQQEVIDALHKIRPDIVIHTAGMTAPLSQRYGRRLEKVMKSINVNGTSNMLEAARRCGCKAFVYTSSCCAVTDDLHGHFANIDERWPVSRKSLIYGESKVEAEELVMAANDEKMATCVLRPSVLFGEGDYILVPSIHACIAKRETPYRLGNGLNLWDATYVGNVADAHVLAAKNLMSSRTAAGEAFFIQNNEPISFRDFSLAIWKEFGHYPPFEVTIPEGLGMLVGTLAEVWAWVTGAPTTISRGSVLDACAMRYASGEKARRILGYEPRVGLETALQRSCQEYARRLEAHSNRTLLARHR